MALSNELIKCLDNEDEPLPKRLKLADNAFKAVELPIQRREALLFKWLSNLVDDEKREGWTLLYKWLNSEHMRELSLTDLTEKEVKDLSKLFKMRFKKSSTLNGEVKRLIIDSVVALTGNGIFRHYFKFDLKNYFELIAHTLKSIDDQELLLQVLRNDDVFHKVYFSVEKFHKYFIEIVLSVLTSVVYNFKDNNVVFQEISKLLQTCIFQKNFKDFEGYFKEIFEVCEEHVEHPVPKQIFTHLRTCYKHSSSETKYMFKLFFNSFYISYSNNFSLIYKFLVLLHEMIGFNLADTFKLHESEKIHNKMCNFSVSVEILLEVYNVLGSNKNVMDCKLAEISFSDFIQTTILSVIRLAQKPDANIFDVMNQAIVINPLIIEPMITEILIYAMLPNNANCRDSYERLLLNVFEVFAKLHRMPHLISKMIRALRSCDENGTPGAQATYAFDGEVERQRPDGESEIRNILPDSVLQYFTQCVTNLASWQVMKLFKTLLFHLNSAISEDLQAITEDGKNLIYIEIVCTLMCQLLMSVRIAEHTVSDVTVGKFVACMEELKSLLGKCGATLVAMEHNLTLMRIYLNMCYTWGELYIVLSYYSVNNEISFVKNIDNDYSACNITYVHSYLTTEQWCLISQRITNFGEKPCKQLMQKLFTQRVKSTLLFENGVNEEIVNSYVKSSTLSLGDCWEDIVSDAFVLNTVLPKMQEVHVLELANLFITNGNVNNLRSSLEVLDNQLFTNAVMYTLMSKINKLFKHKLKLDETLSFSTSAYSIIHENLFSHGIDDEGANNVAQTVENIFQCLLLNASGNQSKCRNVKLNEERITSHLELLRMLPVTSLKPHVQVAVFLYLLSVLVDVNRYASCQSCLKQQLETVLIGMLQNTSVPFLRYIKYEDLVECIVRNFENYKKPTTYLIENMFRREESLKGVESVVDQLLRDLSSPKHLHCLVVILNAVGKVRRAKISADTKGIVLECKRKIHQNLLKLITSSQGEIIAPHLIHPYALLLKDSLLNSEENFSTLLPYLDGFVESAMNNFITQDCTKDALILFLTLLHNMGKFESLKEDFMVKVWNVCKAINAADGHLDDYSKVVVLIFEHVSTEQFFNMANDLLQFMRKILKEKNYESFYVQIKIWHSITSCTFNSAKVKIYQETLESLLQELLACLNDTDGIGKFHEEVGRFETHIIQTVHVPLTASLLDMLLLSVAAIMSSKSPSTFKESFTTAVTIMEALLIFRRMFITDRLPSYLQQYRVLLYGLLKKSDASLKLSATEIQDASDCAHQLEKLTKRLLKLERHLVRIVAYLIADVLHQYEEISLYPSVKMHVDNCVYGLMTLCDQHSVSYLMRVLSTASTEMFKFMYDNYKKYYRFTGKV